jgi:hypothetical protein
MASIFQDAEGHHESTHPQVNRLQYVIQSFGDGSNERHHMRNDWGEMPALHIRKHEKILHKEREVLLIPCIYILSSWLLMEGASDKISSTVVSRTYERWSELCCGSTDEATIVYLQAHQGMAKFNHHHSVSTS